MISSSQSSCSLFSCYPPKPFAPALETTRQTQDFPSYKLFPIPLEESTNQQQETDLNLQKTSAILSEIKANLTHFNQSMLPRYEISERDIDIILKTFFKTVDPSSQESVFFDKTLMKTRHSAVYFKDNQNHPCLFIKPNVKYTLFEKIRCFDDPIMSFGAEKMIKKNGFLIVFSKDLSTTVASLRYASFSKSFSNGKNQTLKSHWESDCLRNNFFPISFQDGKKVSRHMFLIPYLGERIDTLWDKLTLEGKIYCVKKIIDNAKNEKINDIKIGNTLIFPPRKNREPEVFLIDGNDKKIVYTYTPYSEPHKNRKGRFFAQKTEKMSQFEKEMIEDLNILLEHVKHLQSETSQNPVNLSEFKKSCKRFILNLKHPNTVWKIFSKLNFQEIQKQILKAITEYKVDLARLEYLASPASDQEITEARIFSLAIMFWQLLNKNRVLNVHALNDVFEYSKDKITPASCRENRKKWCLHRNQRDDVPLTEMLLKGYENNLSYSELLKAVCAQLQQEAD